MHEPATANIEHGAGHGVNAGRQGAPARKAGARPVLEVDALSYSYGEKPALRGLSFEILPGEFVILLGHNGAGKTTLFSLLTGLYYSPRGRITVAGYEIRKHPSHALRHLGVVFQQRSLDADLSVWQNLKYSASLYGFSPKTAKRLAQREMEHSGLQDRMHDKVRTLSGGQSRRVEIARSLMNRPDLLILDEPTFGLDIHSRDTLLRHVRTLCEQEGLAALWTTHLLEEIQPSDRLLILKQGVLVKDAVAQQLAGVEDLAAMRRELTRFL